MESNYIQAFKIWMEHKEDIINCAHYPDMIKEQCNFKELGRLHQLLIQMDEDEFKRIRNIMNITIADIAKANNDDLSINIVMDFIFEK